jgi:hypothetical protein
MWRAAAQLPALCMLFLAAPLLALDVPVAGKSIAVQRKPNGKEKLKFSADDAAIVMPAPGSEADPLTPGGGPVIVDVVSGDAPVAAFRLPHGAGWSSKRAGELAYSNKAAPAGESVVRKLTLTQGKKLKIDVRRAGLGLEGAEGTVGIRITFGRGTPDELRLCSQFGGTIQKDEPGAFSAKGAEVLLGDCSDAALATYGDLHDAIPPSVDACGPGYDGVGSSTQPGTDLHRVTLDDALALCNDGSPAVFYIRPAPPGSGHEHDWLFWLEGGGGCLDPEDCAERWCGVAGQADKGPHKMSSLYTHESIRGVGIFRQGGAEASNFRDWNQVVTYYCSSDNYVGRDTVDVEATGPYPGYKIHFDGQAILTAILAAVETGASSDDGLATLPPIAAGARFLFTGTSGGGQGAILNVDRVAAWAEAAQVGSFFVSIDARTVPQWDDTTHLDATTKELLLAGGQAVADFRNDIPDDSCAAHHAADDPRLCTDSAHVLLHHVGETYFIHQDQEDPVVGPGPYGTFANFATAVRKALVSQFLQRPTVVLAEEAALANLPTPVVFSPRCHHHVGLESSAFFDNEVQNAPAPARDYNAGLFAYVEGASPPSLIDGVDGATTTSCTP